MTRPKLVKQVVFSPIHQRVHRKCVNFNMEAGPRYTIERSNKTEQQDCNISIKSLKLRVTTSCSLQATWPLTPWPIMPYWMEIMQCVRSVCPATIQITRQIQTGNNNAQVKWIKNSYCNPSSREMCTTWKYIEYQLSTVRGEMSFRWFTKRCQVYRRGPKEVIHLKQKDSRLVSLFWILFPFFESYTKTSLWARNRAIVEPHIEARIISRRAT